jgi:hypothetical protein
MARFLVTYHGSEMPHDPEIMAQAREAFMQWAAKTGHALPEPGEPTGASKVVSRDGTGDGPADGPFSGWSVVEAPDVGAAMQLLADHPFIGRGGILQVSIPAAFD